MRKVYMYVIYRLDFSNGCYYIGKATIYHERMYKHKTDLRKIKNLKVSTIIECQGFTPRILCVAPSYLPDGDKKVWMDNVERMVIHDEARKVYNKLTGQDTSYYDYQPYKDIINKILVNTQLY